MRDLVRLSLTLALVAVLSASLLTGVHSVTDPVISARQEEDYYRALERFFPGVEKFESEEIEGERFDLVYDEEGEKLGIMSTVKARGYEGIINYNLALNPDGEIIGLIIISHSETPGIGDVITTDGFKDQFIGKGYEDPIDEGEDVDIVSGATYSTSVMISSIRRTVRLVGETFLGRERTAFDPSVVQSGIYRGTVDGTNGEMTVEVEIVEGRITKIDIIEQNETEAYFVEAYPKIPEKIIAEQSLDVDVRIGATLSAERIVAAVESALDSAPVNGEGGDAARE